jgi:hypothetical protein
MHALIKHFESEIPPYKVNIAVLDGGRFFYQLRGEYNIASRDFPLFDWVNFNRKNRLYKNMDDDPGSNHAFIVSQVLTSPNTTYENNKGNPNPFMVGGVYSSQAFHFQAHISNSQNSSLRFKLIDSKNPDQKNTLNYKSDGMWLTDAYLIAGGTLIGPRDGREYCGYNSECALNNPSNARWVLDRGPDRSNPNPPIPDLINLSTGNAIPDFPEDFIEENSKAGMKCDAGKISGMLELIVKLFNTKIISAHSNFAGEKDQSSINCPNVINVSGYHTNIAFEKFPKNNDKDKILAGGHDFYVKHPKLKGMAISPVSRTVAAPFERYYHHLENLDPLKFIHSLSIIEGTSYATPLITSRVAEMMGRHPGGPKNLSVEQVYNLLIYGTDRSAYAPDPDNERKALGNNAKVPIVNFSCAMASVLVANLRWRRNNNNIDMKTIYDELGRNRAYAIFDGQECDAPFNPLPLPQNCSEDQCSADPASP